MHFDIRRNTFKPTVYRSKSKQTPLYKLSKYLRMLHAVQQPMFNTAVLRKVVGKSACDNPERYCGWFCLPCSPEKIERMAREATDICSPALMESNKSRFDSYSRQEQCIDHIPYYLSGLSRAHFFRQPFSKQLYTKILT